MGNKIKISKIEHGHTVTDEETQLTNTYNRVDYTSARYVPHVNGICTVTGLKIVDPKLNTFAEIEEAYIKMNDSDATYYNRMLLAEIAVASGHYVAVGTLAVPKNEASDWLIVIKGTSIDTIRKSKYLEDPQSYILPRDLYNIDTLEKTCVYYLSSIRNTPKYSNPEHPGYIKLTNKDQDGRQYIPTIGEDVIKYIYTDIEYGNKTAYNLNPETIKEIETMSNKNNEATEPVNTSDYLKVFDETFESTINVA